MSAADRLNTGLVSLCLLLSLTACASGPYERTGTRIFWPLDDTGPKLEFVGNFRSDLDLTPGVGRNSTLAGFLGRNAEVVLQRPFGIVPAGIGEVLVTDTRLGNIFRFDFSSRRVRRFTQFFAGTPMGIDRDAAGNVYVANKTSRKIHVFSPDGRPTSVIGGEDDLETPSFVTVNQGLRRIYVADAPRHRVVVFDFDGNRLFDIGAPGSGPGEFGAPQAMAFDREGRLFVADMFNARVQVFDADGRFLYMFGRQSTNHWDFENPRGLAFADDGTLYVADHRKALLLAYHPDGQFLFALGKGKATDHPIGFSTPTALSIAADGTLYVTEQLNGRFSVWQILNDSYLQRRPLTAGDLADLAKSREKYRRLYMRISN